MATAHEVAVTQVVGQLGKHLPRKLVVVDPAAYPTYREFAKAASRGGCVLQACPLNVIGSPSVNLLVEPDGCVRLLSTFD